MSMVPALLSVRNLSKSYGGVHAVRSVSFDEICLSLTGTYRRERQFRFQRIVRASVLRAPAAY